jgi:hypothetical protein
LQGFDLPPINSVQEVLAALTAIVAACATATSRRPRGEPERSLRHFHVAAAGGGEGARN